MNNTPSVRFTPRTLSLRLCALMLLGILFDLLLPMFASPTVAAANDRPFHVFLPISIATQSAASSTNTAVLDVSEVVELTNALRQQHGCPALTISPELTAAASLHSQDMADQNYFSHTDLNGQQSGDRARLAGYQGTAGWENIAAGYTTAADVVAGWYNETPPNDGHRQNILNCTLTEIGVGYTNKIGSQYGTYWTQDFGQRLP